jgi:hypothetical protein
MSVVTTKKLQMKEKDKRSSSNVRGICTRPVPELVPRVLIQEEAPQKTTVTTTVKEVDWVNFPAQAAKLRSKTYAEQVNKANKLKQERQHKNLVKVEKRQLDKASLQVAKSKNSDVLQDLKNDYRLKWLKGAVTRLDCDLEMIN